jgi:hypothetical protein
VTPLEQGFSDCCAGAPSATTRILFQHSHWKRHYFYYKSGEKTTYAYSTLFSWGPGILLTL